jgi:hypothetical protein
MLTSITASRFEGRVAAGNQAGCKESQSLASYFSLYSRFFPQRSENEESVAFWAQISASEPSRIPSNNGVLR